MAFGNLGQSDGDEHSDMAEINIIPLVDVMLVLLIVFMVAAPLSISGIKVDIPTSRAKGVSVSEKKVILSIDKEGNFYFDKLQVPRRDLTQKILGIFEFKDKKELYIRADRVVSYGVVVDAMGAAKLAGVSKIAMLTKPELESVRK